MKIVLNGEPRELDEATTLEELMTVLTGSTRGSAAAVDGAVIPRREWSEFVLRDGHVVELLTAVQGG